tara:strand:+ start:236 stop:481 length:246 start_codon:yes stop_codon:yes gene_type:complete
MYNIGCGKGILDRYESNNYFKFCLDEHVSKLEDEFRLLKAENDLMKHDIEKISESLIDKANDIKDLLRKTPDLANTMLRLI